MPYLIGVLVAIQAGIAPPPVQASDLTKDDLRAVAIMYAVKYDLDPVRFVKVIECESSFNRNAEGDFRDGVPTSFGIAQFHQPERYWGITVEQAKQPVFAIELMAKTWQKGEHYKNKWTCYGLTKNSLPDVVR